MFAPLIKNKEQLESQGDRQAAFFPNSQRNDNQIESVQVWYRIFKYTRGEHYSEHRIPLGRGYFIDLYVGTIPSFVETFERLQNRTPALERHLARLRFYQRWFEPVIRFPLLLLLSRLLVKVRGLGKRSLPTIQNNHPVHSQFSTDNQDI